MKSNYVMYLRANVAALYMISPIQLVSAQKNTLNFIYLFIFTTDEIFDLLPDFHRIVVRWCTLERILCKKRFWRRKKTDVAEVATFIVQLEPSIS